MSGIYKLSSPYKPTGDQPAAIAEMLKRFAGGAQHVVLEGVTGSGKTFSMANVIEKQTRPVLVISHNKTLAAQLYSELKGFFPDNAVEYFISYYDYYQPEAYIPQTDTFIEKDASINEEIERHRLSATNALMNRQDVIVVASVSCIYGLGNPEDYRSMMVEVDSSQPLDRDALLERLIAVQYTRNDFEPQPGVFRVRGDTVDIFPSYSTKGVRVEFFGDEIEQISITDPLTNEVEARVDQLLISPAKHFVTPYDKLARAMNRIRAEMNDRVACFEEQDKLLEAQRISMRTRYDLEMMKEMGFCSGIENYSRHITGRAEGEAPYTMLDYFGDDFLTIIDESHVTLPQVRGMYNGDQARKSTLVEHGFRLPSAKDNRPLNFSEFTRKTGQILYTSATPGPYELDLAGSSVRQVIRPTGLLDPRVVLRPLNNQVDDLLEEVRAHAARQERILVTTLTKRTAEDLTDYFRDLGVRVRYVHSDIGALERVEILRDLRMAAFDCLIGVNLLREGLDLPEVSLVAVFDADKEGFLRSRTALIQIAGRAARHVDGKVILYADNITDSMKAMMDITSSRRQVQEAYNEKHGITPASVKRDLEDDMGFSYSREGESVNEAVVAETGADYDVQTVIQQMQEDMLEAAGSLEFERAAVLRDELRELKAAHNLSVKD